MPRPPLHPLPPLMLVWCRDKHWTGLGLGWIRIITIFWGLDWIRTVNGFKVRIRTGIVWVNGKELRHYSCEKTLFEIFWTLFGLGLHIFQIFGLWLAFVMDRTWIVKYDCLLVSRVATKIIEPWYVIACVRLKATPFLCFACGRDEGSIKII